MASIQRLNTVQDLEAILQESARHPVFLFKHSTACPVSAWAYREFQKYAMDLASQEATLALVRVIEERPLSLEAASRLGVVHASPQVILIREGRPVWHTSHYEASSVAMLAAIKHFYPPTKA